jgi:hypothetical protein
MLENFLQLHLLSCRLASEGHALFSLTATPKGVIFQDKIVRFSASSRNPLPFHRFHAGDTVKVSRSRSPRYSELHSGQRAVLAGSLDGVVLERRLWHIDVCINADAFYMHDWHGCYRLDSYVNKTSYDRMKSGLKALTAPLVNPDGTSASDRLHLMSHALRDLLLCTYPDAIQRLASSPGGLELALPPLTHSAEHPVPAIVACDSTAAANRNSTVKDFDTMNYGASLELPIMQASGKLRLFAGLSVPGSSVDPGRYTMQTVCRTRKQMLKLLISSRKCVCSGTLRGARALGGPSVGGLAAPARDAHLPGERAPECEPAARVDDSTAAAADHAHPRTARYREGKDTKTLYWL